MSRASQDVFVLEIILRTGRRKDIECNYYAENTGSVIEIILKIRLEIRTNPLRPPVKVSGSSQFKTSLTIPKSESFTLPSELQRMLAG